jgi:2-polyprenyl-3-methyl-5-hydroxy-6-metoxy-1,4-benzoquinol methylase
MAARQVPTPLFDVYAAFMTARTIMAGSSLGVFDALADRPATAPELAERLSLDPLGTDALLVALHTIGYLDSDRDGRYRPADVVGRWLEPLRAFVVDFSYDMWEAWGQVEHAVRTGEPVGGLHDRPGDDPHWERYMRGLFALSRMAGSDLARAVGAKDPRTLLDIAGGHGGFSIAMCERHPGLSATVLELEGAARVGRAIVAEEGFADRVTYQVGDMFDADLGGPYDVALAGQIVHHLSPEDAVRLLARARDAVRPGGLVAVYEQERPPAGERGHAIGVLTGLMFFAYSRARTYTADEVRGFLREAGLESVRVKRPIRLPGTFVAVGRRA